MPKEKKSTKVRKPVSSGIEAGSAEDFEERITADSDSEPVEDEIEAKTVNVGEKKASVVVPSSARARAQVVLDGATSLRRQGRVFVRGRPFFVDGEEAIEFFKRDKRFIVSRVS